MKDKFKKFIVIFCIFTIGLCSLSFVNLFNLNSEPKNEIVNASIDDLGKHKVLRTQEKYFTFDNVDSLNHMSTYNLFVEKNAQETEKYYSVSLTDGGSLEIAGSLTGSYTFLGNDATIFTEGTLATKLSYRNPRVSIVFKISDELLQAAKNNSLSLTFTADVKAPDDNFYARFQNGAIDANNLFNLKSQNTKVSNVGPLSGNEFKHISLTIDNPTENGFVVILANDFVKGGNNQMFVNNPQITISTTDNQKPETIKSISDKAWSKDSKVVSFLVNDNGSGLNLKSAKINNQTVSNYEKVENGYLFKHTVSTNEDVSFEIKDNVGNLSQTTFFANDVKIDNVDVGNLDIKMPQGNSSNTKSLTFTTTFTRDGLSNETIHYVVSNDKNVEDPTILSPTLKNGENTITFPNNGDYYLKMILFDEVGHKSETYVERIRIDDTKYKIGVSSKNGTYEIVGATKNEEDNSYYAYYGNEITVNYTPNENYEFYKLFRYGNEEFASKTSYTFVCLADIEINIVNRFKVAMSNFETNYSYNENSEVSLNYTLNTAEQLDLTFEMFLGEEQIYSIKDAGNYKVKWFIDNDNFVGSGEYDVVVNPLLKQITYNNNDNFVYNGSIQQINFENIDGLDIIINYFKEDKLAEFKNAGSYKIVLSFSNPNYKIENDTIFVEIAKKQITANVTKTNFKYTSKEQNILYTLDEDIKHSVKYYVEDVLTIFKNANIYNFTIVPNDVENYEILNNTGTATIDKVNVNVVVNKQVYDYTGATIKLDYTLFDENQEEILFVNGLQIEFKVDNNVLEFKTPNNYIYTFKTDDLNYVLTNVSGNASIVKVTVNVVVTKTDYEYNGQNLNLEYHFTNENGDILAEANNIELKFYQQEQLAEFKNIGTYNYQFSTTDINYDIVNSTGTVNVVACELNIVVNNDIYTYDENGTNLDYTITSSFGVDYTNNSLVSLNILKDGISSNILNVGTYDYEFVSLDLNITLKGNLKGSIKVDAQTVNVEPVLEYTFTGNEITFEYTLSKQIDVTLTVDTILNVNTYTYKIVSNDANYVLSNNEGTFVVNPMKVSISSYQNSYEYTGSIINIVASLSKDIKFNITAKINDKITELKNVGRYTIEINSMDKNYQIVDNVKEVIVTTKTLDINVLNKNFVYDKTNKQITVDIKENVNYKVTYYNLGNISTSQIDAGKYDFVVEIIDDNYAGRCEGVMEISKRKAVVKVDSDQFKMYGNQDTTLTYTLENVVDGDIIDVVLQREIGETIGIYEINLVSANHKNYTIEFKSNYYKIIAKKIVVIADNKTKTFEEKDCELTYQIVGNGMLEGDVLSGNLIRQPGEDIGEYEIGIGTLKNDNYKIIFKKATYKIEPKPLTILIDNITTEYGQNKDLTYKVEGDYNNLYIKGRLQREQGNNVGEYKITKGTISSENYSLNFVEGVYKIVPKNLIVKADNVVKTYGEEDNLTYTVLGLIEEDVLNGTLLREPGENVGEYIINIGTLNNSNYNIDFTAGKLVVNKAPLNILIDNLTQVYGEEEKEYTYKIEGLKLDDKIELDLFRSGGNDVGKYIISCGFKPLLNYFIANLQTGIYEITKGTIVPKLSDLVVTYNKNPQVVKAVNFPFELTYIYKLNGVKFDEAINAGEYLVQAIFEGNNNYLPSKSNIVTLKINKQKICFTLGNNNFIYDGEVKIPNYYYNTESGLKNSSIIFEYENNIEPKEVGVYNYTIKVLDDNYEGQASGKIKIEKRFTIIGNDYLVECDDATFDKNAGVVSFIQNNKKGKFNNQRVLKECYFENSGLENDYIYTVKVKAPKDAKNVYVYMVSDNNEITEMVVSIKDGYFEFKTDNLSNQYIITEEIEPMSLIVLLSIGMGVLIVLFVIRSAFKIRKKRKRANII